MCSFKFYIADPCLKEKKKLSKKHKANEEKCKKKELDKQKEEKRKKVFKIVMVSLIRERLIMRGHCLSVERTNYM